MTNKRKSNQPFWKGTQREVDRTRRAKKKSVRWEEPPEPTIETGSGKSYRLDEREDRRPNKFDKRNPRGNDRRGSEQRGNGPKKFGNEPEKQEPQKPKLPDPNEPVRLNRFIAQAGVCSRREADNLIKMGKITVNGEVATEMGMKITPNKDEVKHNGKLLKAEKFVYILLNKPKNMITTTDDPQGRKIVLDAIHKATQHRVFPVGRLDRNTTGLLLLTNDGDMAKRLTHPSYKVKKIYKVKLDNPFSQEDMEKLIEGITLEDGPVKVDGIDYVANAGPDEVGVTISMGKNRIVRRMFAHLGYEVIGLDRVMFGSLTKKNLPRGKWRELNQKEINFLKMS
ncbi:pseudouridine synthase [Pontibacter sp. G13]|uniref:pseudouridine synthase n=1 Tax=Pontibacter sp. G13 TaxID=3074898 RepID=UPI00288AA7FC|nr:pseudouridine synthase [Pontibacter sp. G13]WNJ16443.1 pseudouridine synthase [Pontibacter sp. G13]